MYFERIRYTKPISTNIYEFNFTNHWEQITNLLDLEDNVIETARIKNLMIDYYISGEIKGIMYELVWKVNKQLYQAPVSYDQIQKNINVKVFKVPELPQYESMFRANSLFSNLNEVSIEDLTSKENYPYYGFSIGVWNSPTIPDGEIFAIKENSIVPFKREVPGKSYWIRTYGMEQFQANYYRSSNHQYYLVNLQ